MVGFAIDTRDQAAFIRTAESYAANCTPTPIADSDVLCLMKDPSGAELRIGIRRDAAGRGEIRDMDPAFSGSGRTVVSIVADLSDPAEKPFEFTVSARFDGEETPLVFDIANPLEHEDFRPGTKLTVNLSAFSYQPTVFKDEAAYYQAQTGGAKFASTFFIPTGMFFEKTGGAMPDGAARPVAYADFAGKVIKSELRTNAIGKGQFWWALVETYKGSTVDVVMDPSSVKSDPIPGSFIAGRFWLTARLSQATDPSP